MFAEREDGKCHKKAIWWRAEEARVTSSYIVVGNVSGHPGCDKSCQIGHHIRNAEKSPSIIWGQFYMVQLKTKKEYTCTADCNFHVNCLHIMCNFQGVPRDQVVSQLNVKIVWVFFQLVTARDETRSRDVSRKRSNFVVSRNGHFSDRLVVSKKANSSLSDRQAGCAR